MIEAIAKSDISNFITTACYGHPDDVPVIEGWEAVLHRPNATLLPVYLPCPMETLRERIVQPDRAALKKLNSISGLETCFNRNGFQPLPAQTV